MQVKVFEADNMASALKKVKEALGPEALIVSTRTVRKGGLGLLGKPVLEVTAAVEPGSAPGRKEGEESSIPTTSASPREGATLPQPGRHYGAADDPLSYEDLWRRRKVIDPLEEEVRDIKGRLSGLDLDALRGEISELKALVRGTVAKAPTPQGPSGPAPSRRIAQLKEVLAACGVDPGVADQVVRRGMERIASGEKPATVEGFLHPVIAGMVKVSGGFSTPPGGQRRIALVGPTGVGKTTTIAKLAAEYLLRGGRKLALLTIDIYRIAAAEQLKVYGEIMKLPVEVIQNSDEMSAALDRYRNKELILIDTAGRSPRDKAGLEELAALLGPASGVENHLVLSATTREKELAGALRRFAPLQPQSLIFSKLDECESHGALLNVLLKNKYPLSYLTNGQRVPEDILVAEPSRVAGIILGKG